MIQTSYAGPIQALHAALPEQIQGWSAEPNDRFFDDETIFDYINGAGEVYRAYNMRKCLSRRYTAPNGPAIVLDIFDMQSSEDAFGVFTHDQDGEPVDVGQGGLYRSGWLSFWKGQFFISIYMEEESGAAERAVRGLAKEVASRIPEEGQKPRIVSFLPQKGLQPRTTRYLHHYILLNYHFYLADDNILNLGPDTKAVLAEYKRGRDNAEFLLVQYPEREIAEKAHKRFLSTYLPEAVSTGPVLLENSKWSAAAQRGRLLVIVLEADSRGLAETLLNEVKSLR
ncbi:MAG: hypothetical protein PVH82_14230, partial [Desulfobacteraceae bacterium]|jgi:hypothetical protein